MKRGLIRLCNLEKAPRKTGLDWDSVFSDSPV